MIYILEDDESIRKLVVYGLESQGFTVEGFALPSAFHRAMERALPELVLLDLMLPEEDGLHILRDLRASAATRTLPVILLTARDTEYDRVIGLDGGADDFITKPFSMLELAARIRARAPADRLRRAARIPRRAAACLSGAAHRAGGRRRHHTDEQGIRTVVPAAGKSGHRPRTRNADGSRVGHGAGAGEPHARRPRPTLRAKLGPAGGLIETVRGVGYRIGGERT